MQLALGEARRMAEQSGHGVADAVRVFEAFTEHHVATALAVNLAGLGKLREPSTKMLRSRKRSRVQLRIAAGQPTAIAVLRWRLVGERRERDDLRSGSPPSVEDMGINKREGRVGRERDALAGRRYRSSVRRCREDRLCRRRDHRIEIEMAFRQVGEAIEA